MSQKKGQYLEFFYGKTFKITNNDQQNMYANQPAQARPGPKLLCLWCKH